MAAFVTLKCEVDPKTGLPSKNLSSEAITYLEKFSSKDMVLSTLAVGAIEQEVLVKVDIDDWKF